MTMEINFQTPLLRVSRPVSACQRCRGAKIKCDGKLPACTACEKAGRFEECSSAKDHFAKGKERSYVTSLETQIETLERRIAQARNQNVSIDALGMASAPGQLTPKVHSSAGSRKLEKQEASNVDDLVSDFGFLSVNATARDFHGFSKEISFARLVLSMSFSKAIPTDSSKFSLPPRYAIAPLIQHYVDKVHGVYPFLSETLLFRSVDRVFGQDGLHATPSDYWITLMTLAISHASHVRLYGDSHYQEALKYTAAALKHVEHVMRPGSRSGIQALLLIALLAMWIPHHFNSWYLIGIASRATVDLGLHQVAQNELPTNSTDISDEFKIFHCVYSLDRHISLVYRRPFSFTDDSINVSPLGERLKMYDRRPLFSASLKPAQDLLHLRQIQSTSYQKLFQSSPFPLQAAWPLIHTAVRDLAEWYAISSSQQDSTLRNYYCYEAMYAIFLTVTPTRSEKASAYGQFLVLQYAMEYAESIHSAFKYASGRVGLYTSLDLQRISFAAQQFLSLLTCDHGTLFSTSLPTAPTATLDSAGPLEITTTWPLLRQPLFFNDDIVGRLSRVQVSLGHFENAIDHFCSMYGYEEPLQEYRMNAKKAKQILKLEN